MMIQIEQTKASLEKIGVEVEYLRWWDEQQTGDILHFFGRMPTGLLIMARRKGLKVVKSLFLTGQGSRSPWRLWLQGRIMHGMECVAPRVLVEPLHWASHRLADACVVNTTWEAQIVRLLYRTPPERIHVVPNGVEEVFFQTPPWERGPWLVCTATITERKRVLELAEAAVAAQTPVWIIGKPYAEADVYYQSFEQLCRSHPQYLRYQGPMQDRRALAEIYRQARGFVLLSSMETRSLSAEEAAACGCPLLLSDLPWARSVFGDSVSYCPVTRRCAVTARHLRKFYDEATRLSPPPRPKGWIEVAEMFKSIYEEVCASSTSTVR
jgi:glycosyltransferase involved in cell wall biosynthesis